MLEEYLTPYTTQKRSLAQRELSPMTLSVRLELQI